LLVNDNTAECGI